MSMNLNILKKKLHSYRLSPIEVEILLCFAQYNLLQANKVSNLLPAVHRVKGP